MHSCTEEMVI